MIWQTNTASSAVSECSASITCDNKVLLARAANEIFLSRNISACPKDLNDLKFAIDDSVTLSIYSKWKKTLH